MDDGLPQEPQHSWLHEVLQAPQRFLSLFWVSIITRNGGEIVVEPLNLIHLVDQSPTKVFTFFRFSIPDFFYPLIMVT